MGQFHPSPHGRIKDLPEYQYKDVDFGTMLDVAKGRRYQGSRSTSEKGYEPSYNRENLYKVEMSEVDKIAESKGEAWLEKLRKMLKMGGGKVMVTEKSGDYATVTMNHPWGINMGTMEVPMSVLRQAAEKEWKDTKYPVYLPKKRDAPKRISIREVLDIVKDGLQHFLHVDIEDHSSYLVLESNDGNPIIIRCKQDGVSNVDVHIIRDDISQRVVVYADKYLKEEEKEEKERWEFNVAKVVGYLMRGIAVVKSPDVRGFSRSFPYSKLPNIATILPLKMVEPWTDAYGNPVEPDKMKIEAQEPLRRRPDYGEIEQEIEKRMSKISSNILASSFMTEQEMSLPEDACQPESTREGVFKSAAEAEPLMRVWLEEISRKLALHHFHQIVYGIPKIDFDGEGPILITTAMKGMDRSEEKVMGDYGGDWSKLLDIVRAAIAVDKISDIGGVLDVLRESGMKLARRPKDRFQKPDSCGFRDIHLNIVLPNGHIGEIQVHLKSMLKAREEVHKYYEELREIDAKKEIEGRVDYTSEEQVIVDEISKVLAQKYGEALMKAGGLKMASGNKCREFKAPEKVVNPENLPSVFEAGAIDQGSATDWQKELTSALKDVNCVVLNPRRNDWDASWKQEIENDQFREQVEWELDGMEKATLIAMCLTKDSKAPISLLELGLHASEGRMIVCCPKEFYRKGNVDIVCKRYGVKVFEDFEEFKAEVVERMRMPNAIRSSMASDGIGRRIMARRFITGMLKINTQKKEAKMNMLDKVLAMEDTVLVPRDVVAQICGSCAEKMDKSNLTALRASVIKQAYKNFQAKDGDSISAAVKDFRATSQVPQLDLTKVPNKEKQAAIVDRLLKMAKNVIAVS